MKETEKCILCYKNHLEIIQFYVLRIPDVDVILGLPWIDKHNPSNYHEAKKIVFSSGFCARYCFNRKRRRSKRKGTTKRNKMDFLEQELKVTDEEKMKEPSCSRSTLTPRTEESQMVANIIIIKTKTINYMATFVKL